MEKAGENIIQKLKREFLLGKFSLLAIFALTISIVGLFEIGFLAKFGNTPQVYKDIVLEELGAEFANKSIEFVLYIIGTILGLSILSFFFFLKRKNAFSEEQELNHQLLSLIIFAGLILGFYIFYGYLQTTLVLALTCFTVYYTFKRNPLYGLINFFMSFYAISALQRIAALFGHGEANVSIISVAALCLTLFLCLFVHLLFAS